MSAVGTGEGNGPGHNVREKRAGIGRVDFDQLAEFKAVGFRAGDAHLQTFGVSVFWDLGYMGSFRR